MEIKNFSNIIRKKLDNHRKKKILYLRTIVHLLKYFLFKKFRSERCIIDPSSDFFYKYRNLKNYFSFITLFLSKYLKKKNIFISVNNDCNSSMGHIYAEIDQLKRMQKLNDKYIGSTIWFLTSRKEILKETRHIFEEENFKIIFGGIKRLFFTFIAMKYLDISIDGSIGHVSYTMGKNHSDRHVFYEITKQRAKLISNSQDFYPNKNKLSYFNEEKLKLMKGLNISKKYLIIQIKTFLSNGTLKPLNPELLLDTIEYFKKKNYQIIFAGRERIPKIFLNNSVIDYANSKYASPLNDFLLVGNSSLVISSGSGFCALPESLNKPLLILNAHHICQYPGPRTIYLPTLLTRGSKKFNATFQQEYLFTYGKRCGFFKFKDMKILHIPSSEEILMASKELEIFLLEKNVSFTPIQNKIHSSI